MMEILSGREFGELEQKLEGISAREKCQKIKY